MSILHLTFVWLLVGEACSVARPLTRLLPRGISLEQLRTLDPAVGPTSVIDSSTVGEAGHKGLGLFAAFPIEAHRPLGYYEGELLTQSQYSSRYPRGESRYAFLVLDTCQRRERVYIDSADPRRSNQARYMNHSHESNVRSRLRHWDVERRTCLGFEASQRSVGVCMRQSKGCHIFAIEFLSQRDIAAGEELLFNYGELYTSFI